MKKYNSRFAKDKFLRKAAFVEAKAMVICMDNRSKLEKLRKTVLEDAKKKSSEIYNEVQKTKKERIEKESIRIKKEAEVLIQSSIREISSKTGKEISAKINESRKEVLAKREEGIHSIFQIISEELKQFVRSSSYSEYLTNAYYGAKSELNGITRVFVRHDDLSMINELIRDENGIDVEEDRSIKIGGLIAENKNLLVDMTLDKKLNDEKERFSSENSFNIG